jgi:GxxExxY protein
MTSIYKVDRIATNMEAGQREGLTRSIIGCAFSVSNELGSGFLESVYEKAMTVALNMQGIAVQAQAPINATSVRKW